MTDQPAQPSNAIARLAAAVYRSGCKGKYLTTVNSCSCPDHLYRHRTCKHMIALREGKNAAGEHRAR